MSLTQSRPGHHAVRKGGTGRFHHGLQVIAYVTLYIVYAPISLFKI